MKTLDPKPYDQATRDTAVKLFMELMAFSAAADYSRVAVLKIGDRIDDHVYTYNGQSAKFHDVSHRQVANSVDFHHYIDRMMMGYYKYLLDTVSQYNTPTGPLFDQGVTIYTNQCATGAHSFSNIPWIQAGTANGYYKKGQYLVVGTGQQPGGGQDGKGGDASVSGVNKMLNTLLTAAGVTKTGGAPTDDFGEPSCPRGSSPRCTHASRSPLAIASSPRAVEERLGPLSAQKIHEPRHRRPHGAAAGHQAAVRDPG